MMAKKLITILFFAFVLSCKKEAVVEQIQFYISINDFELKEQFIIDNEDIPFIAYEIAGGNVTFTNSTDSYLFNTKETSIENFLFELPAGIYNMEIETPAASLYGQNTPSFRSDLIEVEISDLTDTIAVDVEPTCALIVVADDKNQLENGAFILECRSLGNDNCLSHPLVNDSLNGTYYTYILPDTVPELPNAFLWLYGEAEGEEKGGLHTEVFEIGYKYLIKVLE
jgi:hypothetical protein